MTDEKMCVRGREGISFPCAPAPSVRAWGLGLLLAEVALVKDIPSRPRTHIFPDYGIMVETVMEWIYGQLSVYPLHRYFL